MIQIENLSFAYKKGKPILEDITTSLQSGRIYGLLGLNGEGKTTFLRLLAGLIFPTSGSIELDGLSTRLRSSRFFEQLYMLPDQPLSPNLTMQGFVQIYGAFYKNFSNDFFNYALKDLGLDVKEKIKSLSLGQQKKFHLAFALATNTPYLLLDEPTNGLDIPSKNIVRKLLAKSIAPDKTILISTHLIKDVENLLDHLLLFKNGKLALNLHTLDILQRYTFVQSNTPHSQAIYAEQSLSIYRSILNNTQHLESNVDIELLFNAVQHDKI